MRFSAGLSSGRPVAAALEKSYFEENSRTSKWIVNERDAMGTVRRLAVTMVFCLPAMTVAAQVLPPEQQIAGAVSPAPEELQAGAKVYGYAADGRFTTLREGTNEMVCIADDPSDDRFHAACYHASLEPFMARGRALRAEGKDRADVMRIREEEANAGTLKMPDQPAALYSFTGSPESFNPETGEVTGARRLYVVYIPYATAESTGLSPHGGSGTPWIMDPGKPWAHIMISPE